MSILTIGNYTLKHFDLNAKEIMDLLETISGFQLQQDFIQL
jgi:NADH:ubiquinone oxidoreductase subunit D